MGEAVPSGGSPARLRVRVDGVRDPWPQRLAPPLLPGGLWMVTPYMARLAAPEGASGSIRQRPRSRFEPPRPGPHLGFPEPPEGLVQLFEREAGRGASSIAAPENLDAAMTPGRLASPSVRAAVGHEVGRS